MKRLALICAVILAPTLSLADRAQSVLETVVHVHILPRFEVLAEASDVLAAQAAQDCDPTSQDLRAAYGQAFDAWVSASHLRFGPTEKNDRAFALAFWPDSRGATPRSLGTLIAQDDPIALSVEAFGDVSIAARGFYAMEFMLFDESLRTGADQGYFCTLVQTMSADIAATSKTILNDWRSDFTSTMLNPGADQVYRSDAEVLQVLFKSLTTGLQFTAETRLGRPLGTFDRPRPARAEARRSGRSARHVQLSLLSLRDLAVHLSAQKPELAKSLDKEFDHALTLLGALNDPVFAGVAQPQSRLKVEVIQQAVELIRVKARDELGPTLGVAAGFNSLDGD